MITDFPFERVFAMRTVEASRAIRRELLMNAGMTVTDAITVIRRVELDASALDLEAGEALLAQIPAHLPNDGPQFYRGCISTILLAFRPYWARLMLQGKMRLYEALARDEQSLFRQTGVTDSLPDNDFVVWWDGLTGELRLVIDLQKLAQGRTAERMTIDFERQRLAALGIDREPEWVGMDDNTKGYDVLSYDWHGNTVVNKLIEVKSTIASPARYRVTRNEWEQAVRAGDRYVFYVWDMTVPNPKPRMRTVEQVRPHIPTDNDRGKWKDVEILLGADP